MKRLLDFARSSPSPTVRPVRTFADVGAALGVTSAVISNWKVRGLSKDGALKAEAAFGCAAQWLLHGDGLAVVITPTQAGEQPVPPVGRRLFSTKVQRQILDDLGDLLPEEGDALIQDLHARADKMRRHREYILALGQPQEAASAPRQGARYR